MLQRQLAGFFEVVSHFNLLEILPVHHQNHKNTLKNTSIFKWSLWKAVVVREQSVSEYSELLRVVLYASGLYTYLFYFYLLYFF
ncbi:hypothetical protein E2C01_088727 [Portunus trituberculatus]|uniref:Uncharacterized protein n=1 Tax=Portunus trituberculatus TaxID=210409 RepID=A0A5B7JGU4_PORTR|nr:hypothetical protein [Portunus trituberculatus]